MTKFTRLLHLENMESRRVPAELLHSLFPDPTGPQDHCQFGAAVAVSNNMVVVGVPAMDLSGDYDIGQVDVFDLAGKLQHTLINPAPAANDKFGTSVAVSGQFVVVGAPYDDAGGTDSGSVYVYDLNSASPDVPAYTLANPTPAANDRFGLSVAVSGHLVVVGAPYDDAGGADAGAAYVYDLSSAMPGMPAYVLSNSTPSAGDTFGVSVAITDNRAVVGAPYDDAGATDAGSVYVYDLTSTTPTAPALMLANPAPAAAFGRFGAAVAVSGRLVVVGAPLENAGSVYVYDLTSTTPAVPSHTITNPNPGSHDFGFATAFSTVSGDLVVVAANASNGYHGYYWDLGKAYVYNLASAVPTVPALTLEEQWGSTGLAVAVRGDFVVVGAPRDIGDAEFAGSSLVFDLKSATPAAPVLSLGNVGPPSHDSFAHRLAMDGTTLVIGAPWDDTGAANAGAAYVFDLSSAAPDVPILMLYNPAPAAFAYFGMSAAVSGNLVVVGAPVIDHVYVYDLSSATPGVPILTLHVFIGEARFGYSMALSDNLLVVGSISNGELAPSGPVYVYDLSSATPVVPVLTLNNPTPTTVRSFGVSVALSGDTVVVGAPRGTSKSSFVYDLSSATPTAPVLTLNEPAPTLGRWFGFSVAASGHHVSIGAPSGTTNAGRTYVYDLKSATPTMPALTLEHPSPPAGDLFGYSVAMSGPLVVVGSLSDEDVPGDKGSVFVFDLTSAMPAVAVHTILNPTLGVDYEDDQFAGSLAVSGKFVAIGAPHDGTQNPGQGAAYVYTLAPPRIADVQINDGSAQRSRVTSLAVTFDQPINFAANPANAFQLTRQTDGASVCLNSFVDGNTVRLTFTGGPLDFGSLADGRYTLTIDSSQVTNSNGPLDGDADGKAGGNYVLVGTPANGLFRLYGDFDGDAGVYATDFAAFRLDYGASGPSPFDFDNDGQVGLSDFNAFRSRFGVSI